MKEKGFDKPVKYIFIGEANTTKTTLAKKAGLKVFETDGLTEEEVLDIKFYREDTDVIIIGGKWIKYQLQIVQLLVKAFRQDFQLIQVRFTAPVYDTLKFFVERKNKDIENYGEGGYNVYIATADRIMQIFLDNDDGYRSHSYPVPEEEIDGFKFWLKMEGGKQKVFEVEYDEILFGFRNTTEGEFTDSLSVDIRAKFHGKTVFEIGTNNADDYYPSYYMQWGEKGLEEALKESELDE